MTTIDKVWKLYLCTEQEDKGDSNFQNYFKWGITTQKTARARSSSYIETHRFVETPLARPAEQAINGIVYYLTPEYEHKCGQNRNIWTERVEADFPFDLLCDIWDYVADLSTTCHGDLKEFNKKLPNPAQAPCSDTTFIGYQLLPLPAFDNELLQSWRKRFTDSFYAQTQSMKNVEPMWS